MKQPFAIVLLIALLLSGSIPAGMAQPATPASDTCLTVSEPNDQPQDALEIGPGAACATGQNPGGGQDLLRWSVTPDEADTRWSFSLSAIPGQVGLIEIYAVEEEAGTILSATKLVSQMGAAGANTEVANLMWAPGEYYIGVAFSGAGPYQFAITEGDPLPAPANASDTPITATGPLTVSDTRDVTDDVIAWTIDDPTTHLDLQVQGPAGIALSWTLTDEAGNQLAGGAVDSAGIGSLRDLGLASGPYTLTITSPSPDPVRWLVTAIESGERSNTAEDEPNDNATSAMPITMDGDSATIQGRLATTPTDSDRDTYRLTVDDSLAGRLTDIRMLWQGDASRSLCLLDGTEAELRCTNGEGGLAINDLVLAPGDYLVQVSGVPDSAIPYTLKIDVTGEAVAGFEAEPNDAIANASPLVPEGDTWVSAGRLQSGNRDVFRMTVTGEPQLWLIEAQSTGQFDVSLLDANGNTVTKSSVSDGVAAIYDAFLLPGDHGIAVSGDGGDYTVAVTPLGPPDPAFEHEPNDSLDRSQPIALLEQRSGRLATINDVDAYRFSLQNETYLTVTLDAPTDAVLRLSFDRANTGIVDLVSPAPGDDLAWSGMLPAGDYQITLAAGPTSLDPYAITLTPSDPYQTPDDLEPNGTEIDAVPMPDSLQVSGTLDPSDQYGDGDWYVLPPFDAAGQVVISYTPSIQVEVLAASDGTNPSYTLPVVMGTEAGDVLVDIPAGIPILIHLSGVGPYDVAVSPVDDPQPFVATPLAGPQTGLMLEIDPGTEDPAAYWTDAQVVEATLAIANEGSDAVELTLDARTGHAAWRVEFDSETIAVGAGDTVSVPIRIVVAPDAWADAPIFVAIEARDGDTFAGAMTFITPSRTAPPLNAEPWSALPEPMQGGLNVAWSGLGGTPVAIDATAAEAEAQLYDQLLIAGTGVRVDSFALPAEFTVDLAGDQPIPVQGVILFPLGLDTGPDTALHGFEFQLSTDGQTFETVLTGELTPEAAEQPFALDAPVDATHARLRLLSAQSPAATSVSLGEWKVVADPTWQSPETPFNLADPDIGGHVVDMQPPPLYNQFLQQLLTPDGERQTIETSGGAPVTWIVGFHNDRAAQITGIGWQDPPESDKVTRFNTVTVETSTASPVGPWEPLGEFTIERDGSGQASIDFDEPAWARFVRFTASGGTGQPAEATPEAATIWELPDQVSIREAPVEGDYRSILGEWGTFSSNAIYEQAVAPPQIVLDDDAGNDAASATALAPGSDHTDSAAVEADEDWFAIEVPPGDGTLAVTLDGYPALGVTAALFDESGTEIPVEIEPTTATSITVTAEVEPGSTYRLRVTQPPTSVVFAFDTSFSIGPLETAVYQALTRFAGDVLPGRETVNILPFGEQLLLDAPSDEPYYLQSTIINYPRTATSSDAEGALVIANESLAAQPGSHAIFLITDAENNPAQDTMTKLWPGLAAAAPRIYAVHIAGGPASGGHPQDLLQDWSLVNSGSYEYVRNQGELDIAFDRAATELRRPAIYTVSAETSAPQATPTPVPTPTPAPTPTPEPTATPAADGSLQVLAPEAIPGEPSVLPAAQEGNVAIILDTSGSMLQELEGSTRADIAKTALIDLVNNTIPAGTTVSLRTFGDTPDSCDTILTVQPGPLDPAAMADVIANLPIVNLVKTPIGASLEAVAADLGTEDGPKLVVLVTDGEETCDGDPAAAIQALVDSGIDVRVNIVGFAIDDAALQAQFTEWAQIGNGQYIDAGNADELNQAVAQAVMPTFDVLDASGTVIASGQVGADPIDLPPGTYQVVIRSDPEIVIDEVTIASGEETEVELPMP